MKLFNNGKNMYKFKNFCIVTGNDFWETKSSLLKIETSTNTKIMILPEQGKGISEIRDYIHYVNELYNSKNYRFIILTFNDFIVNSFKDYIDTIVYVHNNDNIREINVKDDNLWDKLNKNNTMIHLIESMYNTEIL